MLEMISMLTLFAMVVEVKKAQELLRLSLSGFDAIHVRGLIVYSC